MSKLVFLEKIAFDISSKLSPQTYEEQFDLGLHFLLMYLWGTYGKSVYFNPCHVE